MNLQAAAAEVVQSEIYSEDENEFVNPPPNFIISQETHFLSKHPHPIDEYEKEICHLLPSGTLVAEN